MPHGEDPKELLLLILIPSLGECEHDGDSTQGLGTGLLFPQSRPEWGS